MIRLSDHYEWVVLGDQPGALLSGCLAAKLGLSVLILPVAAPFCLAVSHSGQFFDPETNSILGLGGAGPSEGLVARCLFRSGMLASEAGLIRTYGMIPQVLTPKVRVAFGEESGGWAQALMREVGEKAVSDFGLLETLAKAEARCWGFWRSLPDRLTVAEKNSEKGPKGKEQNFSLSTDHLGISDSRWLSRSTGISSLFSTLPASSRNTLPEFSSGIWYGISGFDQVDPVSSVFLQMLALSKTGASFRGGMSAYRQFLLRLAQRLGAHVPDKAECGRVFVERGRLLGVQIAHRGNMITVGGGTLGCSLSEIRDRIVTDGENTPGKLRSSLSPQGWKFTLALTVRREGIPPGVTQRMVWSETGASCLEIEFADSADYGLRDDDHRVLYLRTRVPFSTESLGTSFQRMLAARMFRQATEILPFLEFHVTRVYPDFRSALPQEARNESNNDEFSAAFGFAMPELVPGSLRVYSGEGVGVNSGIEGLFVNSNESYPKLGSLGPSVAAVEAVAWAAHRNGLAGPFV
ncbi:hypothetical protein WDW86_14130 [Bdellovibrionota bacterium FG-2]